MPSSAAPPRPPSTDGAPRPAVGAPSTDQVGERRNSRSGGLRVRGFRGRRDPDRARCGRIVSAGRGGVAQPVGWCNPQVASRRPMRSSHEPPCGHCGGPPSLIRCLRCVASASVPSRRAAGERPAVRCQALTGVRRRRAPVDGTRNGRHSFAHMAPLCCQRLEEPAEVRSGLASEVGVASMLAGSESDLSEASALGFKPAALDFVVAPRCPSGPVLRASV